MEIFLYSLQHSVFVLMLGGKQRIKQVQHNVTNSYSKQLLPKSSG